MSCKSTAGRKGYPCFKLDADSLEGCMGETKARLHPDISPATRDYLRQTFKPIIEQFNSETGMEIRLS